MRRSALAVAGRTQRTRKAIPILALSLFLALVLVSVVNVAMPMPATATGAVAPLDPWPGDPQMSGTSGNPANVSYEISAGADRVLVVLVCLYDSALPGASGHTYSATYGGRTLTQAYVQNNARKWSTWIGYLKEGDIATRSGDAVTVTVTGTHTDVVAYIATYSGVDQSAPIAAANGTYVNNLNNVTIGGPLNVTAGDYGIYGWSGTGGVTRSSDTETYTEHSDRNTGTGAGFSNGVASKAFATTTATNPSVRWSEKTRASVSFITLRPESRYPLPTTTSISPTSKTVGDAAFVLTVNGTGFVSGKSVVRLDGADMTTAFVSSTQLTAQISASELAAAGSKVITVYTSAPGGGTSNAQNLMVNKCTPTITWANPADMVYGTSLSSTQLCATASVPGAFVYSPVSGTSLPAGDGQTLHVAFTPTDSANYNNASKDVTVNVNKAALIITASDRSKTYGDAITFAGTEFSSNGLVSGDTVTSVTLTSAGVSGAATLGTYAIVPSAAVGTGLGNYTISYVNGALTVNVRSVTVTADDNGKIHGEADPPLTYHISSGSLATGDTFTGAIARQAGEDVGTYDIQQGTLTLNGNYSLTFIKGTFTIAPNQIPNQIPNQPGNVSPASGAVGLSLTPTLQSSAFSDPDAGDTHGASQWQITGTSGNYAGPIFDSGTSSANLLSIAVPSGKLAYSTTYYWHVRHQDSHGGWSSWSAETSFATMSAPNRVPNQPGNVSPASGAVGLSLTPTLQSSAFSDPDAGDTHGASQWQITGTSGNYAGPIFDSGTSSANLLSIAVPSGKLAYSTTYYWHVRHQDSHGGWSSWSAETSFATMSAPNRVPNQPGNVSPASGAAGLSLTPTLQSSAFSDPDAGDTHGASQWQITGTSGNYAGPIFDSGTSSANLLSIAVPSGKLAYSTTYYWHVRHQDSHGGWSSWSAETSFATMSAPNRVPNQPGNVSPASGAAGLSLTPTLQSSAFSDPDAGDTHGASQWQITGTSGNYAGPIFDSGTSSANLLSIAVPSGKLAYSTTYYWHVRHQDSHGGWSSWSAETSFATMSTPAMENTVVSISKPTGPIISGDQFIISIVVVPGAAIAGMQFDLQFDPSLVAVDKVEEGDLLAQNGANTYFNQGHIDNQSGIVRGAFGAIIGAGETVSKNGIFATVTFTAIKGSASCPLTLSSVIVGDMDGNAVPVSLVNESAPEITDAIPVPDSPGNESAPEITDAIPVPDSSGNESAPETTNVIAVPGSPDNESAPEITEARAGFRLWVLSLIVGAALVLIAATIAVLLFRRRQMVRDLQGRNSD